MFASADELEELLDLEGLPLGVGLGEGTGFGFGVGVEFCFGVVATGVLLELELCWVWFA